MKFLENHPKLKLFLQSAIFIAYIIFATIQCSHAIERNLTTPNSFVNTVTAKLGFPDTSNAIGFLYFFGSILCFVLGNIILQAIISLIKDFRTTKSLFKE